MTFVVLSIIIGLVLGFASFYYQELFIAGTLVLSVIGYVLLRPFLLLAPSIAPAVNSSGKSEGYLHDFLAANAAILEALPDGVVTSLILLAMCTILGRLLSWVYYIAYPDSALPHTQAEHSARTLKKFSLKQSRD